MPLFVGPIRSILHNLPQFACQGTLLQGYVSANNKVSLQNRGKSRASICNPCGLEWPTGIPPRRRDQPYKIAELVLRSVLRRDTHLGEIRITLAKYLYRCPVLRTQRESPLKHSTHHYVKRDVSLLSIHHTAHSISALF
jgi:hypothetical protein